MAKNPGMKAALPGGDPEKAKGRMLKNAPTRREMEVERTGRRSSGRGSK